MAGMDTCLFGFLQRLKVQIAIQRRSALPCPWGRGLEVSTGGVLFSSFFVFFYGFSPCRRAPATFLLGYLHVRFIYATLCR